VLLQGRVIEQAIDRDARAAFVKELVVTGGPVPLSMVRKRAAGDGRAGGTRGPVLLVHGFAQNRYAWHLPSRSLANHLAIAGFDVFNLDLRGHGRSLQLGPRRSRSVEDYVSEDLPTAIGEVQSLSGGRPVFVVGHSLGGLVAYAAAPALVGAVAGIVSIGSPYEFARGSLSLTAIALFARAMGTANAALDNPCLPTVAIGATMRMLRRFAESPLYPLPIRPWHAGSVEPHVLDDHLRLAFDRSGLGELTNMFEWAAATRFGGLESRWCERFERLALPLLVVSGANDDLAPADGVKPAFTRSRSPDKTYRMFPLGHIDLLVGRDAPLMTWPLVTRWLVQHAV
jgi:alpha-beta hydrolase superfamily lysophospholipase